MHYSAGHRRSTTETIKMVPKNGGSRPEHIGPECLRRARRRMDGPSTKTCTVDFSGTDPPSQSPGTREPGEWALRPSRTGPRPHCSGGGPSAGVPARLLVRWLTGPALPPDRERSPTDLRSLPGCPSVGRTTGRTCGTGRFRSGDQRADGTVLLQTHPCAQGRPTAGDPFRCEVLDVEADNGVS